MSDPVPTIDDIGGCGGIGDAGTPVGLDANIVTLGRGDLEGYENWLTTLIETATGGAATSNASIDFPSVDGVTICRVAVRPGGSPGYGHMKDDEWLYVRLGNSTRRLSTREAVEYIKHRWRG